MARLIWLIGPSGSGKDSLLNALRDAPPARLLIAHRYITRAADAGGENHVALSEAEFARRAALGFHYGIGTEVESWLQRGQNVVVNGSRLHLAQAQARFGSQLLPLCLQVTPSVLAVRLRQRGREDDAAIARRLARAAQPQPDGCLLLNNDGALDRTVQQLRQLLETHQ